MAVITVLCGIGIVTSYGNYKEQCSTSDSVNYMVDNVSTVPCIYYDSLHKLIKIENGMRYTEDSRVIPSCNEFNIAENKFKFEILFLGWNIYKSDGETHNNILRYKNGMH